MQSKNTSLVLRLRSKSSPGFESILGFALILGFAWIAGGGIDSARAAHHEGGEAGESPVMAKAEEPAAKAGTPAKMAAGSGPPTDPDAVRARLHSDLSSSYPSASDAQIGCFTDRIIEDIGYGRFVELIGVVMKERAGRRKEADRSEAEKSGMKQIEDIRVDCGISGS